jgi:hypothetical protein
MIQRRRLWVAKMGTMGMAMDMGMDMDMGKERERERKGKGKGKGKKGRMGRESEIGIVMGKIMGLFRKKRMGPRIRWFRYRWKIK